MVNIKKYSVAIKHFILILTFFSFLISCTTNYQVTKIEGSRVNINQKTKPIASYEAFIQPYKEHIEKDLDSILSYAPETLDKSKGLWQTNIGDFLADITLERANIVFNAREHKNIDVCILNHGGIRAILPKGNVTTRTAFEIMPFENTTIVVALKGLELEEFAKQFAQEKKPHPIAGISFTIHKDNSVSDIKVRNEPLNLEKTYYVVTSDYLSNGGDNMTFFKKGTHFYDLNYKLRNILIDHFKLNKTIVAPKEVKINLEN
jgi:2',3'-cyclic-nucleotide 2'-phosphodiesterase (5'-nucleotidase family)